MCVRARGYFERDFVYSVRDFYLWIREIFCKSDSLYKNVNCFKKKEWDILKETSWILLCQAAPPLTTADRYISPSWLLSIMHPIPVTNGHVSIHPRTPVHVLHTVTQNIHSLGVLQRVYVLNTYTRTHVHVRVCHACGENPWVRLYTPVRALSEQHARAVCVCVYSYSFSQLLGAFDCVSACVCMFVHTCVCVCVCIYFAPAR